MTAPNRTPNAPEWLARLTHRRWALPVLAELGRTGGCKLVWLERHLGAGRGPAKHALDALTELGLVRPNPGHGHPMRPEYVLTPRGQPVAVASIPLIDALDRLGLRELGLCKWSLPVLHAVHGSETIEAAPRFMQIRSRLPSATDRAVSGSLQDQEEASLLVRTIRGSRPPRPEYAVSAMARAIVKPLLRVTVSAA
ncbi:MAG: DNA-binding HxlR family transcriptional regulator [Phycisphaerales bacterium]|jgi:DNA-binding HxlR family transcriptional regulator